MYYANETKLSQRSKQNTGEQHISLGFRFLRILKKHKKLISKRRLTFGRKKFEKYIANVCVNFGAFNGVAPEQMREVKVKLGFKYFGTHMIFDRKMDDKFNRKSRIVTGGHKMAPPSSITNSSVVTR